MARTAKPVAPTQATAGKKTAPAAKAPRSKPLASYAEKERGERYQRFAAWVEEQTGFKPDAMSLQMAINLYPKFQKSPANAASASGGCPATVPAADLSLRCEVHFAPHEGTAKLSFSHGGEQRLWRLDRASP